MFKYHSGVPDSAKGEFGAEEDFLSDLLFESMLSK